MFVYLDTSKMQWIIYRPEEKKIEEKPMVAKGDSVNVKN